MKRRDFLRAVAAVAALPLIPKPSAADQIVIGRSRWSTVESPGVTGTTGWQYYNGSSWQPYQPDEWIQLHTSQGTRWVKTWQ